MSEPTARVEIVQPIVGSDESAALAFEVTTTPRNTIGSTITQSAARHLIAALQGALNEIAENAVRARLIDSGVDLPDGWAAGRALGRADIHHLIHKSCGFHSFLPFDLVVEGRYALSLISTHECE